MKKALNFLLLIILFAGLQDTLKAQSIRARAGTNHQTLILKNVRIVDVEQRKLLEPMDILISRGGIIGAIGSDLTAEDARIIEMDGKYVIPGLIDSHTHLANATTSANLINKLDHWLRCGITSVRDVGSDSRQLADMKRAINSAQIKGPDIFYSAFLANKYYFERSLGGGAGADRFLTPWKQEVNPGDDLDEVMIAAKAIGATGIKIYYGYDRDMLDKLVAAAQKYGLMTWSHAHLYPAKPSEVAAAGVDVMSHVSMLENDVFTGEINTPRDGAIQKAEIDLFNINLDNFVKIALENDVILDATVMIGSGSVYNRDNTQGQYLFNIVNQLYKKGVKISAGTDWYQDSADGLPILYDEIEILVEKCGFEPIDAIRAATIIAAETFGGQDQKGSIAIGKHADMVILNFNPLEDITSLRKFDSVMKGGVIHKRDEF